MNEAAVQHFEAFLIDEASRQMAGLQHHASSAFNWCVRLPLYTLSRLTVLPTLEDADAVAKWKRNCEQQGVLPRVILCRGCDLSKMPHLWNIRASFLDLLPDGTWVDGGALVSTILTPDAIVLDDWHRIRHGMRRHWRSRAPNMPPAFWRAYASAFSSWYVRGCEANVDGPAWDCSWKLSSSNLQVASVSGSPVPVAADTQNIGPDSAPYLTLQMADLARLRVVQYSDDSRVLHRIGADKPQVSTMRDRQMLRQARERVAKQKRALLEKIAAAESVGQENTQAPRTCVVATKVKAEHQAPSKVRKTSRSTR